MAGKVVVNQVQLGDASTATHNFVWQTNADGTCKLARGNDGVTTQDILTVDASGNVTFPQKVSQTTPQSMIRLNTANGYGSINTVIRRFANVVISQGADITYADSSTLGASFTINANGVYVISYNDSFSSGSNLGVSLNNSQLTTDISSIVVKDVLVQAQSVGATSTGSASCAVYLSVRDVVRAHAAAVSTGIAARAQFTITRTA